MITPVVGFTAIVPFIGPPITATEPGFKVVSISLSLFSTEIASGLSSTVVTVSFSAFGLQFVCDIVTVATEVQILASVTVTE